jgi:chaperonin GroEL
MQDIKVLTGARQVFSHITGNVFDRFGKGLDYMEKLEFGVCDKFVLKKDKCIIVPSNFKNDIVDDIEVEVSLRTAVNTLVEKLKQSIEDSEFEGERDMYRDRVSRLVSGMGTIYVGGDSDIELNYRKMVIDDVQRACFASLKGGIVPGAGIAYLKGMQSLRDGFKHDEDSHTYDYAMGYNALVESLSVVYCKVNENLFVKPEAVDINIDISLDETEFFDGVLPGKGENVNFIDKGIIDPADVVISAVKNAASVAKQLYLTEWVLQLEEQQDNNVLGKMLYPERH